MGRGTNRIYNIISLVFLVLALLILVFVGVAILPAS